MILPIQIPATMLLVYRLLRIVYYLLVCFLLSSFSQYFIFFNFINCSKVFHFSITLCSFFIVFLYCFLYQKLFRVSLYSFYFPHIYLINCPFNMLFLLPFSFFTLCCFLFTSSLLSTFHPFLFALFFYPLHQSFPFILSF